MKLPKFRLPLRRGGRSDDEVEDDEVEEEEKLEEVRGLGRTPTASLPVAPISAARPPQKKRSRLLTVGVAAFLLVICSICALVYLAIPDAGSQVDISALPATTQTAIWIQTRAAEVKTQYAPRTPVSGQGSLDAKATPSVVKVPISGGLGSTVAPTPTAVATTLQSGETPEILQVFILFVKLAFVWGIIGYIAFQASRLSAPKLEVVSDEDASISYSLDPQGRVDTNLKLRLRKKLWGWALKRFWISEESAHRQLHEATAARVRAFAESLDADHWQDMAVFVEQCNEFIEQLLSGTSIKNLEPLENASEEIKEAALEAVTELCNIGSSVAWEVVEIMLGDLIADADLVQWNRREELDRQRLEEERHADERQKLALEQERGIAERAFQTQINTVNAQLAPFRTLLTAGGLRFDDSEKLLAFFQSWLNWSLEQRRLDLAHAELEFKKSQAGRAPESSVAQQTMASALSNLVEWLGRASPEDLANALRGRGFAETVLPSATSSQDGNRNNGGG